MELKFLNHEEEKLMQEYMNKVRAYTREKARKIICKNLCTITDITMWSDDYPLKAFDPNKEMFVIDSKNSKIDPLDFDECVGNIITELSLELGLENPGEACLEYGVTGIYLNFCNR